MDTERTALLYGAQGTQWPGMGRELLSRSVVFDTVVRHCDRSIRRHFDWSLHHEMLIEPSRWRIHADWRFIQPAVTSLQIALTELFAQQGVVPDGVGSLSMGEAAAMHAAGAIGLDDAIDIACGTARMGETTLAPGLMVMVCTGAAACQDLIGDACDEVSIAIDLGPAKTVISGNAAAVRSVLTRAKQCGLAGVPLPLAQAYHSPNVDILAPSFLARLDRLCHRPPRIAVYSSVTAAMVSMPNVEHWWKVCSQPARFHSMVVNMIRDGYRNFIEIGPSPMLGQATYEAAASIGVTVRVQSAMTIADATRPLRIAFEQGAQASLP